VPRPPAKSGSELLHRMVRRIIGVFVCQHRRLVYPPRPDYDICYDCGKKRLRDKTGQGFGKFSHNIDELPRSQQVEERRAAAKHLDAAGRERKSRWFRPGRVVLVFRNGQRRTIGSHAISGKTILVFTKRGAVAVPISELDIPATQAANERRGIQFRLTA
jgi:hypothetical protein